MRDPVADRLLENMNDLCIYRKFTITLHMLIVQPVHIISECIYFLCTYLIFMYIRLHVVCSFCSLIYCIRIFVLDRLSKHQFVFSNQ